MPNHANAGRLPDPAALADIPGLITAYYETKPDPENPADRVAFGTSGHRGSSLNGTFNENHILATTQAICDYRKRAGIDGPVFLGYDTHPLSRPAFSTALEVLVANGVQVLISAGTDYTPTPAISHAIIVYNRGRSSGLADGIVITPSHNPPEDGGFKYNPPHGGPAESAITKAVEAQANELLGNLGQVKRVTEAQARANANVKPWDFLGQYVADLANVIDLDAIRAAGLRIGADALGGAGLDYWAAIADRYKLDMTIRNHVADPAFRFMPLDWDGKIRMDPSSSFAMRSLLDLKDDFDIAFGCDTDHDRHGIVTRSVGLLPANHYLAVCSDYLFSHRPEWKKDLSIGKTVVSSSMIDRVAGKHGRAVYEVPVGFKFFVAGLTDGSLGFVGEESAGGTFLRRDGTVWTTDKDGITPALLSAEMLATTGKDPGEHYTRLEEELGHFWFRRSDAAASKPEKEALGKLTPEAVTNAELAGKPVEVVTNKSGNGEAIGGIKVMTEDGWFAARPSGTEDIYKIYAESFVGEDHLAKIEEGAKALVAAALAGVK